MLSYIQIQPGLQIHELILQINSKQLKGHKLVEKQKFLILMYIQAINFLSAVRDL